MVLAKKRFDLRGRDINALGASFVAFTAKTRMSGIDFQGYEISKGAAEAIKAYVLANGGNYPEECRLVVNKVANDGGNPTGGGPKKSGIGCDLP